MTAEAAANRASVQPQQIKALSIGQPLNGLFRLQGLERHFL
jgi:hypothetical protein